MADDREGMKLLRVPEHFRTVEDVLGYAAKLDLPNILVLSEREDGSLVFLNDGMSFTRANWLIDRLKHLMLDSGRPERRRVAIPEGYGPFVPGS